MKPSVTAVPIEIRDRMSCVSAIAIYIEPQDDASGWLMCRVGWSRKFPSVALIYASDMSGRIDPYDWDGRTMKAAHDYLQKLFDEKATMATPGQVIDVEYILGETSEPKKSEYPG